MSAERTIADAAQLALERIGRPAPIGEIYSVITKTGLYTFNTPNPEHVLRTTIRRHTSNVERGDSRSLLIFEMTDDEIYGLLDPGRSKRVEKTPTPGARRIHRATDKEEIIADLIGNRVGVFREIWRLLLFAAQVGLKNNRREPLVSIDSGKGIDQSTFGNCPAWPGLLYLIALVESESSDILSSSADREEQRIAAFQEYANGGLAVLADFFNNRTIDLEGLLAFIETQTYRTDLKADVAFTI